MTKGDVVDETKEDAFDGEIKSIKDVPEETLANLSNNNEEGENIR